MCVNIVNAKKVKKLVKVWEGKEVKMLNVGNPEVNNSEKQEVK